MPLTFSFGFLEIIFLLVGSFLMFVSSWVITQALFPKFVRAAQESYANPGRIFLIGLGGHVALGLICRLLLEAGTFGRWLSLAILVSGMAVSLAGSAGLARKIGTGMIHPSDKEQPWRRTLRGGTTLGLTLLVPFINLLPLAFILMTGFGSAVISMNRMLTEHKAASRDSASDD